MADDACFQHSAEECGRSKSPICRRLDLRSGREAVRLVVDTGIHAFGWSIEKAGPASDVLVLLGASGHSGGHRGDCGGFSRAFEGSYRGCQVIAGFYIGFQMILGGLLFSESTPKRKAMASDPDYGDQHPGSAGFLDGRVKRSGMAP